MYSQFDPDIQKEVFAQLPEKFKFDAKGGGGNWAENLEADIAKWGDKIKKQFDKIFRQAALAQGLKTVNFEIGVMLGELTQYDIALRNTNKQFDDWIRQLKEVGISQSELARIEEKRAEVIKKLSEEEQGFLSNWYTAVKNIRADLMSLITGSASPLPDIERLDILRKEIGSYGKELSLGDVDELRSLWAQYLQLAQEMYQKPSKEYQDIFWETIEALKKIEEYTRAQLNDYELQELQTGYLEEIMKNTKALAKIPEYQEGTPYVPQTGIYKLHKGEAVIPTGDDIDFNVSIQIDGSDDPQAVAIAVKGEISDFLDSPHGRAKVKYVMRGY
jgi:hypothetical protein